jgi:hypothetical protein
MHVIASVLLLLILATTSAVCAENNEAISSGGDQSEEHVLSPHSATTIHINTDTAQTYKARQERHRYTQLALW